MRLVLLTLLFASTLPLAWARSFTLVVYNVQNLFDADGVAAYEDFQGGNYTPAHLAAKLGNLVKVLAKAGDGAGPDVILFSEIEADRTPQSDVANPDAWLKRHRDKHYTELLARTPLPPKLAGVPAEIWLLKAMHDEGMHGYRVVNGDNTRGALAVKCVIFSRFPVKSSRLHPIPNARPIVEAELDVHGHSLHVFNNHWKSGAGDLVAEADRRASAVVLRQRLDELLAADPNADIVIGGDLNSHYNQKTRYREMKETGINDILGSQGNELAVRGRERDLYNLWFELPSQSRASDAFRGEWGTLMHVIVSRGLYDMRGVQYEDNSFAVMKIPGLNSDSIGLPLRWKPYPAPGVGVSDHFPLIARFRIVEDGRTDRWMPLTGPNTDDGAAVHKVDYAPVDLFKNAANAASFPSGTDLRDGTHNGRIFRLSTSDAHLNDQGHVKVKIHGLEYDVFSPKKDVRARLRDAVRDGVDVEFYGELGTYKGNWQFLVHGKEWVR